MSLYVRVVDGVVRDCWDTPPDCGVGVDGWKNAVEVKPTIIPNRQTYTAHQFDTTKDPVEIVYGINEISVDARKGGLKMNVDTEFRIMIQNQMASPDLIDFNIPAISNAFSAIASKKIQIDACTTHDELDALQL